jgi:hypothetical protein
MLIVDFLGPEETPSHLYVIDISSVACNPVARAGVV